MEISDILRHLAVEEGSFPALKLFWDKRFDLDDLSELPKLTPSQYISENSMTTMERHKLLMKRQRKMRNRQDPTSAELVVESKAVASNMSKSSKVNLLPSTGKPLWKDPINSSDCCCRGSASRWPDGEVRVEPPMIVFQSYKLGEMHKFPIVVRNVSKKCQKVVILMDESYVFKFDECSQRVGKFPCGMCITATITFTPESALEDYFHQLIVSTNTTKVVVPVLALGARPWLTAPDSFFLSDSPVRHWTVKPLTFLNTGKATARFTLDAIGPFCIKPDKGIVPPNHAFIFDVAYFSRFIASHEGEIRMKFDNNEEIFIQLKANAIDYKINLSSPDTRCEDTFIGLQTRSVIHIENNSNITARFLWKKFLFPGQKDEENDKSAEDDGCAEIAKHSEIKIEVVENDGGDQVKPDDGKNGLEKVCKMDIAPFQQDENGDESNVRQIEERDDRFSDENFYIYPLFGDVRANSKAEIHIVFSPKQCKFYERTAYLDITGLETRIPFQLHGRGLGPKFRMGFETLNVGEVAMGGAHTYEIPVQNISEITGIIQCDGVIGSSSGLGMKIEPQFVQVSPSQYSAFYVNFICIGSVGEFRDEIKFTTRDSEETFYVAVIGKLTYPSITFAITEVNLGNLSFGFPKTFFIPLVNESLNSVEVDLKMENDGTEPPADYRAILEAFRKHQFQVPGNRAEFLLEPPKFDLVPRGMQKIKLTMCPNIIREIDTKIKCLIINAAGEDVETIASISIKGEVVVPQIQITKEILHVKDCYIQFPNPSELTLKNSSELPAIYHIVQKPSNHVRVSSEEFIGVVEPWMAMKIPFAVTAAHSGESTTSLELYGAGVDSKLQSVTVKCEAVSSKVYANVKNVDFGKVDTLDDNVTTVEVINMSPVQFLFIANVSAIMLCAKFQDEQSEKGEIWRVEPENGILQSEERLIFNVHVTLREAGFHYAGLRIITTEPQTHIIEVKLKAQGVGAPLVFDPPIPKLVNFGTVFIKQRNFVEYNFVNQGVSPLVLEWRQIGDKQPQNKLEAKPSGRSKIDNSISIIAVEKKGTPTFVFSPQKVTVPPGTTASFTIVATSNVPKSFKDTWNLWTFVPVTKAVQFVDQAEVTPVEGKKEFNNKGSKSSTLRKSNSKANKRKLPLNEPANLQLRPSILQEVTLHAVFEAPGLKFSKKTVVFYIEATPTHEIFIGEEIIKVQNTGHLPLRARLKTKFPFSICEQHDDNPQDELTYDFDPGKSLPLKLRFDGRHLRKELGELTFNAKLEAMYEGLHGGDSIDLRGLVRFPKLIIDRAKVDFGKINNGMEAVEQITVTNPGTFCLTYKWYIKPGSTSIQKSPTPAWTNDMSFDKYRPSLNNSLKIFNRKSSTDRDKGGPAARNKFLESLGIKTPICKKDESSNSKYEDFTGFIREKMYRSRMMEFMGLRDAEYEAEDEVNYLSYYDQDADMPFEEEHFNTNELIDVIPLSGLIQAGQSQTFTFVFYGYPDIDFAATLILFVEGGARKTVEVVGSTAPPKVKLNSISISKKSSNKHSS